MKGEKEIRQLGVAAKIEERADGTVGSIYGYPIVYNRDSEDMGFVEQIAPGAAKKALKRSDIRGLKNHDPSLIFARQGVNLTLSEDKDGLRYDATPIDTRNYREIAEEVRTGLLTGQSFGFTVLADEWSDLDSDHPKRTITEIGEIFDVGPVTYPAYQDTSVALRSLDSAKESFDKEDIIPEAPKDGLNITIRTPDGEDDYVFLGEERFDLAIEKITSLRSELSPKTADSDNTEPDPTIKTDSDQPDETLTKINERIKRYSDEND